MSAENPRYATFDINNESEYGSDSKYIQKVFKPGIEYVIPKAPSSWLILPAHVASFEQMRGEAPDPLAVAPYRGFDHALAPWLTGGSLYNFFGPERNYTLLSPKTFGADLLDPMALVFDAARSNPDWCALAGLGRDGKKDQKNPDAYKEAILGPAAPFNFINAMGMDRGDANCGKVKLLMCKKTVFGNPKTKGWGLIDQLQRKLPTKYQQPFDPARLNWNETYEFGDPTDPQATALFQIFKDTPPNGGLAQFNGKLVVDEQGNLETYSLEEKHLRARVYLGDIFQYTDPVELVDLMVNLFGAFPDLLVRALQNRVPNIRERVSRGQATGDPRALTDRQLPADDGHDASEAPMPARRSAPATTAAAPIATRTEDSAPARRAPSPEPTAPTQAAARPAQFAPRRTTPAPTEANGESAAPVRSITAQPRNAAQTDAAVGDILSMLDEEDAGKTAAR